MNSLRIPYVLRKRSVVAVATAAAQQSMYGSILQFPTLIQVISKHTCSLLIQKAIRIHTPTTT